MRTYTICESNHLLLGWGLVAQLCMCIIGQCLITLSIQMCCPWWDGSVSLPCYTFFVTFSMVIRVSNSGIACTSVIDSSQIMLHICEAACSAIGLVHLSIQHLAKWSSQWMAAPWHTNDMRWSANQRYWKQKAFYKQLSIDFKNIFSSREGTYTIQNTFTTVVSPELLNKLKLY